MIESGEEKMGEVIVSMKNIVKTFPGVKALDNVNFELRSGEVMALLGENGAGKSTLMKILSGVYTKDGGTMTIFGKEYEALTPRQAQEVGVEEIHGNLENKPVIACALPISKMLSSSRSNFVNSLSRPAKVCISRLSMCWKCWRATRRKHK